MKDFTTRFNQLNKEIVNDIKCVLRLLPGHRAVLDAIEENDPDTYNETDLMPSVICYAGDSLETCAVRSVKLTEGYEIEARVEPVDYDGDIVSVTERDILPQTLTGLYETLCKVAGIADEPGVPPYRVYTHIGATDLPDEVRGSHKTYQDACNAVNAYLAEHQASLYIFDAAGDEITIISSLAEED